ncbi:MAG TPA: DUF2817 domain-containing protein, partial [Candidatus Hydrogenedentes bacterium]|nr:DUF2817 domain-containing protein [Candidatus Hydrogenedentota bacterium]
MKKAALICICCAVLLAVAGGVVHWRISVSRNTGGKPQAARSFAARQSRMEAVAATSDSMTLQTLGEVRTGDGAWPIQMLSFTPEEPVQWRVLLSAGVHGNEPAGVECLLQFAEALSGKADVYPAIVFDIVPLVNPWGWIHRRRRNADNRDLNRDFASFHAQESAIMRDLCRRNAYDLMVDLHEDSHVAGFYFYRLAHQDAALCRRIIAAVRDAGHPIHDGRVSKIFRARDGVITCPLWSLRLARIARQL